MYCSYLTLFSSSSKFILIFLIQVSFNFFISFSFLFIFEIYVNIFNIFFSSFSNVLIPLFILSISLIILFENDKYSSNFSFVLVTSICKLSFISFSFLINSSCFLLKYSIISLSTFSYNLSISIISFSILFFKFSTFCLFSSNSFAELFIFIFSFLIASSSSIGTTLCPL